MKLTLQRIYALEEHRAYAVMDDEGNVLGFLASRKAKKEGKKWAFAYVESQFRQFLNFKYDSRLEALDALVSCRELEANTGSLTVVKTPIHI